MINKNEDTHYRDSATFYRINRDVSKDVSNTANAQKMARKSFELIGREIKEKLLNIPASYCFLLAFRTVMRGLPLLSVKASQIHNANEAFFFWRKEDRANNLLTIFSSCTMIIGGNCKVSSSGINFSSLIPREASDETISFLHVLNLLTEVEEHYSENQNYDNYAATATSTIIAAIIDAANNICDSNLFLNEFENEISVIRPNKVFYPINIITFLSTKLFSDVVSADWKVLLSNFINDTLELNASFDVWLDWYNERLQGKPIDLDLLFRYENIPMEIKILGAKKINPYLYELNKQSRANTVPLNRVRAIFIGYSEAGKTSLIRALHGEKVVEGKEPMSAGIDVRNWRVPDTEIEAHFWDFGGQVVFHSTHKFFLRASCVYVVVINARADINSSEQAEYWLDHVKVFGGSAPVLLVGNKADEAQIHLHIQSLCQKYPNIKGFYPLSCIQAFTNFSPQFASFKKALSKELQAIGIHQVRFTPDQSKVLDELREYSTDHAFLSEQEFHAICDRHGISDEGELNRDWLVDIFDKLGVMLHFEELKTFNDSYMLNPRWLTYGVYTLMNAKQARLNDQDMVNILKAAPVQDEYQHLLSYPPDKCLFISKAMQRFRLCYPLPNGANALLIPALLCDELPRYPTELQDEATLRFEFAFNGFLPRNLIGEFMVSRHEEIKGDLQSQRGAVFASKTLRAEALVEADYHRRLLVMQVYGRDAKDYLMILYDAMISVFGELELDYREWVELPRSACLDNDRRRFEQKTEKAPYQQLLAYVRKQQATFIAESGLEYDVKKVLGYFLSEIGQTKQGIINHVYDVNSTVTQIKEQLMSNQTVTISHSTVHGSVLTAETIENCLNTVQALPTNNGIKPLLSELLRHLAELNGKIPAEKIKPISRDVEDLVNEINSENPRKRNSLFSLEGIKEAAITLGETAKPIIEIAEKISPYLQNL